VVIEEIREKIEKFLEFNENERTTYQNIWDKEKAVLRRKFIAMSAYIKNTDGIYVILCMLVVKERMYFFISSF
jgi:hypothetical protein